MCRPLHINLAWCSWIFMLGHQYVVFCGSLLHWPLIVFQKVNSSPYEAVPQQRWPWMSRRTEDSIYQHHMMYNGTISCSSVRSKGRLAQLSVLHWGGRDVWWIQKMLSYFGAVRCERGFTGRAPLIGAFPGSALTIRTDEDVSSR